MQTPEVHIVDLNRDDGVATRFAAATTDVVREVACSASGPVMWACVSESRDRNTLHVLQRRSPLMSDFSLTEQRAVDDDSERFLTIRGTTVLYTSRTHLNAFKIAERIDCIHSCSLSQLLAGSPFHLLTSLNLTNDLLLSGFQMAE